ncbi:hypothetical protein CUROG_03250 [Corynebacterium urogenitale]|uniref:Uncharacterized protein n=1 Tax=Corynebacterium urogenitale TaxID=2487892 RepID=A0A5J6Z8S8_9CORY|nr:hypothetical protein CUROG_03250 [Corynebacterium urogenitale]
MHYDANLRVRELTQNIYDIGDEIAEHIDHVAQSMKDWDPELVEDCLLELDEIVHEGRQEVRPQLSELNGLRQAFVSGVRSGQMSGSTRSYSSLGQTNFAHPGRTLSFMHKGKAVMADAVASDDKNECAQSGELVEPESMASTATWRLWMRQSIEAMTAELDELAEWVVGQTQAALEAQSVLLPQVYSKAREQTIEIAGRFGAVIDRQPELAQGMRGEAPPPFLQDRARIEAVLNRIQQRREARDAAV